MKLTQKQIKDFERITNSKLDKFEAFSGESKEGSYFFKNEMGKTTISLFEEEDSFGIVDMEYCDSTMLRRMADVLEGGVMFNPNEDEKEELNYAFKGKGISDYIWLEGKNKQDNDIPLKALLTLAREGIEQEDFNECYRHSKCHYIENCACTDEYNEFYDKYIDFIYKKLNMQKEDR